MGMFSMPGESDLEESFIFGRGRTQIPSLACLFDSVIWNEWVTEVSYYDLIYLCSNFEIDFVCFELMRHLHSFFFSGYLNEIFDEVKLVSWTF